MVLWTRVTPDGYRRRIRVKLIVAKDPSFRQIVFRRYYSAVPASDYTVKIDAHGLRPGTTYFYRFLSEGEASPTGRTRTLPRHTDHVRFGLASCSNYPFGFFAGYGHLADKPDLDALIHVGDYIYEYANGTYGDGSAIGRIPSPNRETVDLSDYRWRYGQYRSDPQLQEAHRQHPWIITWDDHETTNDAWEGGAENHDDTEGDWEDRKLAARRAWFEWLPVRDPGGSRYRSGRIFRRFQFGDLLQLDMLDTRLFGREQQVPPLFDFTTGQLLVSPDDLFDLYLPELNRADRQLLGGRQKENGFTTSLQSQPGAGSSGSSLGNR